MTNTVLAQSMESISSFETSVEVQRTTRYYIPEDRILQRDYCCQIHVKAELVLPETRGCYDLSVHRANIAHAITERFYCKEKCIVT
jgi:hypothetical protein